MQNTAGVRNEHTLYLHLLLNAVQRLLNGKLWLLDAIACSYEQVLEVSCEEDKELLGRMWRNELWV